MKITLIIGLLLLAFGYPALARVVTIDRMSCKQAQAYTRKHHSYWKDAGPDGAIPIYPVYQLNELSCYGLWVPSAQWENTLDVNHCMIGYYCRYQGHGF